jgi:hypothetical protein
MRSSGAVALMCLVFCIWPLVVHGLIAWFTSTGRRIDWKHIEWPWRNND